MPVSLGPNNSFVGRLVLAAVLTLAFATGSAIAGTVTGRCIAVIDGDTIVVRDANRRRLEVRLNGIDAPEKGQRYGTVAKSHLTSLAYRKEVTVHWTKHDAYGRLVGRVYVEDRDVNLAQINAGLAWAYREYLDELPREDRKGYLAAEQAARNKQLGLWRDSKPTPPWEWRHRQRR